MTTTKRGTDEPGGRAGGRPARARADGPTWSSASVVGTVLGCMLAGGSAVAIPALLLDQTPGSRKSAALAVVSLALVVAVALVVVARRSTRGLDRRVVHGGLVLAVAVITAAVWCGQGGTTAIAALAFYAWVPLFAFAFLRRGEAVPHLLLSSVSCVVVVVATVHTTPIGCATAAVGTAAAGALAAAYFRTLLLHRAATDTLTGLPNRLALVDILQRETGRASRLGSALTVAVIDLDHFKEVNDAGGHHAGDQLLRHVATCWRKELRPGDELVRYGGDEFVLVLPGLDADQAGGLTAHLRGAGDEPCSVGVAQWSPGEDADSTLARADAALYEAKHAGRDRVVTAGAGQRSRPRASSAPSRRRWRRPLLPFGFDPSATDRPDRAVGMAEVLGVLYTAGGLIYLPGMLFDPMPNLPHRMLGIADAVTVVVAGIAVLVVVRWLGERVPTWIAPAGVVVAVVAICGGSATANAGPEGIVGLSLLAWVAMFAFAFFAWPTAVACCALGSAGTVAVAATTIRSNPVGVALLSICTAVGAGLLVGYLKAALRRQSLLDALTSLPNRSALEAELDREIELAARTGIPVSLAVVDLDHFKAVNDQLGHLAGDRVLQAFADTWGRRLREVDRLFRYGGDEFVLVLPGCSAEHATAVLERLRTVGIRPCSVGVAQWSPGDTRETLLARADAAVYRAKAEGRDRITALADHVGHLADTVPRATAPATAAEPGA